MVNMPVVDHAAMRGRVGGRMVGASPWLGFAVRRLGRFVFSLWVLFTAAFLMIHLIPGDPVRGALGTTAPNELVEARRTELGLDDPLLSQYWDHLRGSSAVTSAPRSSPISLPPSTIGDRLPATLSLALLAVVVVAVLAVPLGVVMAALTRGGRRRRSELAFTWATC